MDCNTVEAYVASNFSSISEVSEAQPGISIASLALYMTSPAIAADEAKAKPGTKGPLPGATVNLGRSAQKDVATASQGEAKELAHAGGKGRRKLFIKASVTILVLLAIGSAGWWFFLKPQAAAAPQTVAVTKGDIQQTVLATGVLEASTLVSVGAQVSGRIDKLDVAVGDAVKVGDVIAEIDSLDQQNAVNSVQAALEMAQAQLRSQQATVEQAQAALDRSNALAAKALVSTADLEIAQAAVKTAAAQIDIINAQIKQATINVSTAQLNLGRTKITAPIDGTIVAALVDEGQNVNAVQSSPTIVKLANLQTMVIKAQISEADVPHVKSGQPVYFTILGDPDTRINATLLTIDPAPDSIATESDTATPSTTTAIYYNGLFQVPNPDGKLKIDMTAQVTIVLQEAKGVLLAPSAAIQKSPDGNRSVVEVYDPVSKLTSSKPVTVGIDNNVTAEIKSGLAVGDLVATNVAVSSQSSGPTRGAGAGRLAGGLGGAPLGL
jgi:macrolide-specific efflux system membrane fusion protein